MYVCKEWYNKCLLPLTHNFLISVHFSDLECQLCCSYHCGTIGCWNSTTSSHASRVLWPTDSTSVNSMVQTVHLCLCWLWHSIDSLLKGATVEKASTNHSGMLVLNSSFSHELVSVVVAPHIHTHKNCDKVMVSSWEQEYNVMNSLILLQVLNEALISSPNLVQVYEIDETKPAEIFDISFPYENVSEDDLISFISGNGENNKEKQQSLNSDELVSANRPNIEEIESDSNRELDKDSKVIVHTDAEKQQIAAIMQRLTQKLHLDCSFGFVRMMKVQKPTAKECTIYPLEIFFGIPLGDEQMNAQVSNLIVKKNLFGEENLAKHTENMKLLSTEFMRFVEANLDSSLKVGTEESEPNLFPTKNVYFDGTKITPLLF